MNAPTPPREDLTPAVLLRSTRMTPDNAPEVRQIVLRIEAASHYFPAGQHVGVLVPGPHPFGIREYHRLYTIAGSTASEDGLGAEIELLVRRCAYIDEVSGEEYPGIASNYLCDAQPGDRIELTGPHRSPFRIPADPRSNLLMLGTGTGIAPFRAFVRGIYDERQGWQGKVRLYYGARKGTEMLYMNELNNDLADYYDQATFQAFQSVRSHLLQDEEDALRQGVMDHAEDVWKLVNEPNTYVYVAGLEKVAESLDAGLSQVAGSPEAWQATKQRLKDEQRWSELIYA